MHNDTATGETRTHGRYYAEYVRLDPNNPQDIQGLLDTKDGSAWHLVGVAGLPDNGAVLFWDTQRPSFGRGTA